MKISPASLTFVFMPRSIFYIYAILVCLILVVFAYNVFPIPGTDSIVFIPPALLYSKGLGFNNPIYFVTKFTDSTHTYKFNYYVPFYSYFLGLTSKIYPGIKTIFVICSILGSISIITFSHFIFAKLPKKLSGYFKILVFLSVSYVATYLIPTVGRPEIITTLLTLIIFLLYRKRDSISKPFFNTIICILFALILSTQIICFYFCFLFFVSAELITSKSISKIVIENTLRFLAVLVLFCIILAISPNGLINTLNGIRLHMAFVVGRNDRSIPLFIHYWFFAPVNFGFFILFFMAGVFYLRGTYLFIRNSELLKAILITLVQFLILFGFVKFILYASPTVYNATEFILPITAYLLLSIVTITDKTIKICVNGAIMVTFIAGSFLFARWIVLFADYKTSGKDYDTAKPIVNKLMQSNANVYGAHALWSLADDVYKIKGNSIDSFKNGDLIFFQETYAQYQPDTDKRFNIIYDWRSKKCVKFLGIQISKQPHGYGFALCRYVGK